MNLKLSAKTVHAIQPFDKPYEVNDTDIKGLLLRVQPSGVMSYYFSYRTQTGTKKRYRIGRHGTITTAQARDIARRLAGEVAKGIDIQAVKRETVKLAEIESSKHTLKSFLEGPYREWRQLNRKDAASSVRRIRVNFYEMLLDVRLDAITPWMIEQWRNKRKSSGIKPSTINRDLTELKSLLARAMEWGMIAVNPLAGVKPLKTDGKPNIRYLTQVEESQLYAALDAREKKIRVERKNANRWRTKRGYPLLPALMDVRYADYLKPMILFALNTGMRRGEIFNLTWHDIKFSELHLTVHGSKAKSGQTRHIPMNKLVRDMMAQWKHQNSSEIYVFPSKTGGRLDNIAKSWRNLLKLANISNFRFHDLRHHFASKLVMKGVDLNTVRELLGHRDIETTLRYAHLAPEHKAQAVELLV